MKHYRIEWCIDAWGDTPEEAVREAFGIMQRPDTTATVFTAYLYDNGGEGVRIDLEELNDQRSSIVDSNG